ncbi:DUF1839 family protein [Methylobacterium sp. J-092]|uniref:DUF1839 family protein n=1 Tax=Methylobacterium sp. J-092 TaxID=2836667 RepID=UPI001FBB9DD4|nr:DUF1839 family protein [Methylobacterium sp. J-092]MCJ2009429.1 DUF1839 family protein [Methylobacterium sp. J-092]
MPAALALARAPDAAPEPAPHPLHAPARAWPETNCYVDLWIELLHARGLEPEGMLGFTLRQDFEGDQFTFFKPAMADIEALYGLRLEELAVYDGLERHASVQVARGCPVLVEVDAIHLPDTAGTTYGREHAKTTIAILGLDPRRRTLDYLHNAGRFQLAADDYDGIFGPALLAPYAEFVKVVAPPLPPRALRAAARTLLCGHRTRAPRTNPVRAFQAALEQTGEALVLQPLSVFHRYAFNTTRQLGANFELLGSHLAWLDAAGLADLATAAEAATRLAQETKAFQFQLARAFGRRNAAPLAAALERPAASYDAVFSALDRALR